jgi:aarF domain-containing kinase
MLFAACFGLLCSPSSSPSIYFPRAMAPFIGPQVLVQELAHGLPLGKFLHSESFAAKRAEENAELRGKNLSIRERIARQRKKEEEQPGSGDGDGSAAASPALAHPGTSPLHTELARLGLQMYLHMLIEDNFVHSDLHPGNLLVQFPNYPLVGEQQDPAALAKESPAQLSSEHVRLVVLDSGLVSALSRRNRENFLSLFGALILRDGRLAARLMLDNAPRAACTDPQQLQDDMHVIVSAIPLESLASVDLGRLLSEVMNCVRKHHVKLESDFASIIISLAIIEGIGRQLDPNLSLFHQAVPVMLKNKDCRSILLRTAGWKACAKLGLNILKDEIHLAHDHPHHPHAQHHPPPH